LQTLQHFSSLGAHTAAAAANTDAAPPGETTLPQYGRRIHHHPSPVPNDEEFDKAEDAQDVYEEGGEKEEKHEYESTTLQRMEIEDTRHDEHTTHVPPLKRARRRESEEYNTNRARLPVTTYLTPHFIIQRRLLDSGWEIHMMPLVSMCCLLEDTFWGMI
jgi:hypothetical protein